MRSSLFFYLPALLASLCFRSAGADVGDSCSSDSGCSTGAPHCISFGFLQRCGECRSSSDCTTAEPICITRGVFKDHNSCAACDTDSDCTDPADYKCSSDGVCVECKYDSHCTDPADYVCSSDGVCVECEYNFDCNTWYKCESSTCVEDGRFEDNRECHLGIVGGLVVMFTFLILMMFSLFPLLLCLPCYAGKVLPKPGSDTMFFKYKEPKIPDTPEEAKAHGGMFGRKYWSVWFEAVQYVMDLTTALASMVGTIVGPGCLGEVVATFIVATVPAVKLQWIRLKLPTGFYQKKQAQEEAKIAKDKRPMNDCCVRHVNEYIKENPHLHRMDQNGPLFRLIAEWFELLQLALIVTIAVTAKFSAWSMIMLIEKLLFLGWRYFLTPTLTKCAGAKVANVVKIATKGSLEDAVKDGAGLGDGGNGPLT